MPAAARRSVTSSAPRQLGRQRDEADEAVGGDPLLGQARVDREQLVDRDRPPPAG